MLSRRPCRTDLHEPSINPLYAVRVADPDRKGTVENAIGHTQGTALKGRQFESIEAQNAWLAHWEERWAAPRIHGRKKRQVLAMFAEERPALKPLPAERFRYFKQETRTVDDSALVQVDRSYYASSSAPFSEVITRKYDHDIEIFDTAGLLLRRHPRSMRPGHFEMQESDRIFNPLRQTAQLLHKASQLGPHAARLAQQIFARLGRPGQKAIYGLVNLPRRYKQDQIEQACERVLSLSQPSYQALKRILEHHAAQQAARAAADPPTLQQHGAHIRALEEYSAFFRHAVQPRHEPAMATLNPIGSEGVASTVAPRSANEAESATHAEPVN